VFLQRSYSTRIGRIRLQEEEEEEEDLLIKIIIIIIARK